MKKRNVLLKSTKCLFSTLAVSLMTISPSAMSGTLSASVEQDILFGSEDLAGNFNAYGNHLDADEKWFVVGAPRSRLAGELRNGVVYLHKRLPDGSVDPTPHQTIFGKPSNHPFFGSRFGSGVVIMGDTLLVGAAADDTGLLEEFGPDPLCQNPPGVFLEDVGFGSPEDCVDFNNDGIPYSFAGQVYVYNLDPVDQQWKEVQRLSSDVPYYNASFGSRTNGHHMDAFRFGQHKNPRILIVGETSNMVSVFPNPLRPNGFERPKSALHVFKRDKNCTLASMPCPQWKRVQKLTDPRHVALSSETIMADVVEAVETKNGNNKYVSIDSSRNYSFFDPAFPTVDDIPLNADAQVYLYQVNPDGIVKVKGQLKPLQVLNRPDDQGSNDVRVGLNVLGDVEGVFGKSMTSTDGLLVVGHGLYVQTLAQDTTLPYSLPDFNNWEGFPNPIPVLYQAGDVLAAGTEVPVGAIHIYEIGHKGKGGPAKLLQTIVNPVPLSTPFLDADLTGLINFLGTPGDFNGGSGINYTRMGGINKGSISSIDGKMISVGTGAGDQPVDIFVKGHNGLFERKVAIVPPNGPSPGLFPDLDADLNDFIAPGIGFANNFGESTLFMGYGKIAISERFAGFPSASADELVGLTGGVLIYTLEDQHQYVHPGKSQGKSKGKGPNK